MKERMPKLIRKHGIKWLLDDVNAHFLSALLLAEYKFDIIPAPDIPPEDFDYDSFTYTDYLGSVITIDKSRKYGYKIVTWTLPCEAIISDTFCGFKQFSRAQEDDVAKC